MLRLHPRMRQGAVGLILFPMLQGCMAPHGMAPLPMRGVPATEVVGGVGVASNRSVGKLEAGLGGAMSKNFGLDLRLQYLHLEEGDGVDEEGNAAEQSFDMVQPTLRPAFFAGPFTLAFPMAGIAIGAGGGGVVAGTFGTALGYGSDSWNVFSGVQWQGADWTGGAKSSAREVCLGGRYLYGDTWFVSIDPQIILSSHSIRQRSGGNEVPVTTSFASDRTFFMGLLQFSVGYSQPLEPKPTSRDRHAEPTYDPVEPVPCDVFCSEQANLGCGVSHGRCLDACQGRDVIAACREEDEALLLCQGRGPRCLDGRVAFSPCTNLRAQLEACEARHRVAQPSPVGPRATETKSLGEVDP